LPSVFISHSSLDREIASEIKGWLCEQAFDNIFLDFDKETGIGAGKDWARDLYDAVSSCQAVVIIATENWSRSRWCFAEAQQAQALGKVIFPVVTAPSQLTQLDAELRRTQAVVWDEKGKASVASRLREIVDELARGYRWDSSRPPWVGILSLEAADAAVFFGRDHEIIDVAQRLDAKRLLGGPPLTFIVGASGSGKSSLLKAGVLPYLSRSAADWITLPPFRPGADPVASLQNAFATRLEARGVPDWLVTETDPKLAITAMAAKLRHGQFSEATILVAIDQMEELFSVTSSDERQRFIELLRFMLKGDRRRSFLALATIRSDRLGEFLAADGFHLRHEALTVAPMPKARLRLVIEGPARVAGLTSEPALVDHILADAASEGDMLPLIAFALRDMYERREGKKTLSVGEYERLGDPARALRPLENVVRRTAEMVIAAIPPSEADLRAVKEAFVGSLVRIGEDGSRVTRPARMNEISAAARPVLDALVQARLLTTRGEGNQQEIEISHEALLRVWPQLAAWLDEEQEFLLGRRQIEEVRALWTSAPEETKKDALLSGLLLQRARQWHADFPQRLSNVKDFVDQSFEKDRAIQASQRFWIAAAFAFVLVVAAILAGLTIWASNERGQAEAAADVAARQRDKAIQTRSMLLADLARQRNDVNDFGTGIALAVAALTNPYDAQPTDSPEAERALRHALWNLRETHVLNLGQHLYVGALLFSPDGKKLLTGSADAVVRLWDVKTGQLVRAMIGHANNISSAAFTADGSMIATGDSSGGLRVWRGDTGELIRTLRAHDQMITSLEFSRDGKRLLSASWDYTARIDDPSGIARDVTLYGHTNHVWAARFSRDEQTVVTAAEDGLRFFSAIDGHLIRENRSIRGVMSAAYSPAGDTLITTDRGGGLILWDADTGQSRYQRRDLWVACTDCAAFSPDGSRIAAGTKGGVTMFDTATGNVIARTRTIDVHGAEHVRFTPDSQYVFSGAENGSARLDRVSDGSNFEVFNGHADTVDAVAASPDNQTFATGARDGTVRLWTPQPIAGSSYVPFSALSWGAYSSDGRTMAVAERTTGPSGGLEGGLAFYGTEDKTYQEVLPHHHDYIRLGSFSPDGKRVVTVSEGDGVFQRDGKQIFEPPMMLLWDTGKRELVAKLGGHTDRVNRALFSADSRKLLTASNDGTAILWDAATGSLLATLSGHIGIINDAIFSPDGSRIVTISGDRTGRIWDGNGNFIKALEGHIDVLRSVAFSPNGLFVATGSDDFSIRVWHTEDGAAAGILTGHGGGIYSLAFPSNNRILSASADGTARLWSLDSSQPLVVSDKRSYNGGEAAVSDDGALISMSWGDAEVRLFDSISGNHVATLKTLQVEQFQRFIPKSHLLMVTSNYGTEFWSLPAGEKIGEVTLPFAQGQIFYIAPSGDRFAVNDGRGLRDMSLWATTADLLRAAQRFTTHELLRDERYRRFLQ
jgi:WD40 repeat protein